MKYLIVRTDRLGDCILASPVWQALKAARPEAGVSFLTRKSFLPLFKSDPLLDSVITLPEGGRRGMEELSGRLSNMRFDAILTLFVDREIARLIRGTAAAVKAGPLSKPRSWFLFNRPLRQQRSRSLMHEGDYNGRLLQTLGIPYQPRPPRIHLSESQSGREIALRERVLGERFREPFLVVHPGMGGSALNWPRARYQELVDRLLKERSETVIVTGTEEDRSYLGDLPRIVHPRLVNTVGKLDLVEFALLLRRAVVFIGPSTGPMHLATALDTPVVTLFSPVHVQQSRRWGPYHARGSVLTPPVSCPEKHRCRERSCPDYDCMEGISTEDVMVALRRWLDPGLAGP